jgi:CPA2 family monovalent cation:H+ antiporter-2
VARREVDFSLVNAAIDFIRSNHFPQQHDGLYENIDGPGRTGLDARPHNDGDAYSARHQCRVYDYLPAANRPGRTKRGTSSGQSLYWDNPIRCNRFYHRTLGAALADGTGRSRELFLLTVLVLCLGSALSTQIFGLSAVFGSFLMGLVLRETRFAHQALAEVTPLRDVFAALFFVSLGMLLDVKFVMANWVLVLIAVGLIFAIKYIVVSGIIRGFGYSWSIALMGGFGLFQIGEFSFIIAQSGVALQILNSESYALIIGASIITMLLTPFSMALGGRLHGRLSKLPPESRWATVNKAPVLPSETPKIFGDVIIAGFGRVGQNTAQGLQDAGISFHILEVDPEVVQQAKCDKNICTFGDASNLHVLTKVDLKKAKIMVVTFPDPVAVLTTTKNALSINPNLKIIARAHRTRDVEQLKKIGVTELISPEYEASLEFIRRILHTTGLKKTEIKQAMNQVMEDKNISEFEKDEEYQPWL